MPKIGEGFREWLKPLLKDKKGLGLLVKTGALGVVHSLVPFLLLSEEMNEHGVRGYPPITQKGTCDSSQAPTLNSKL